MFNNLLQIFKLKLIFLINIYELKFYTVDLFRIDIITQKHKFYIINI